MKPAYQIQHLVMTGDGKYSITPIGAAWQNKPPSQNYSILFANIPTTFSAQPQSIVYMEPTDKPAQPADIAALIAKNFQPATSETATKYRIVSATKNKDREKPWFQHLGEVIVPVGTDLMILNINAIPFPAENVNLMLIDPTAASSASTAPAGETQAGQPPSTQWQQPATTEDPTA